MCYVEIFIYESFSLRLLFIQHARQQAGILERKLNRNFNELDRKRLFHTHLIANPQIKLPQHFYA